MLCERVVHAHGAALEDKARVAQVAARREPDRLEQRRRVGRRQRPRGGVQRAQAREVVAHARGPEREQRGRGLGLVGVALGERRQRRDWGKGGCAAQSRTVRRGRLSVKGAPRLGGGGRLVASANLSSPWGRAVLHADKRTANVIGHTRPLSFPPSPVLRLTRRLLPAQLPRVVGVGARGDVLAHADADGREPRHAGAAGAHAEQQHHAPLLRAGARVALSPPRLLLVHGLVAVAPSPSN